MDSPGTRPVLILAEDDAGVARSLVRLLQEYFDVTDVVADGESLIERVDRVQPDVIVTDIGLDGMNGLAATRAIRVRHASIPIVIITGSDEGIDNGAASAAGASAFLRKRDVAALVSVVQAVVRQARDG